MYTVREQKTLSYKLDFLYDIVTDIVNYPKFLRWTKKIEIISQKENKMLANVFVEYKSFKEKYTSKISLSEEKDKKIVKIESIGDGPFKFLKSTWVLSSKSADMTEVLFHIEFQMKSSVLEKIIGLLLSSAKGKVISAFEARAKDLTKIS